MNFKMWIQAVKVIPRINKEEWDRLDVVSRWLIGTRAAAMIPSFFAAVIVGLMAAEDGMFSWWRWVLLTIGLIFAHGTNNFLNDLTDFRKGVDVDNYFRTQYGPQPVQQGLMTQRQSLTYAGVSGLIALLAGLPLVILNGWPAVVLLLVGMFFVVFYTWPLKHIGLGELAILLVWGPLMIGGGYYVLTGVWDWNVALLSLINGFGVTAVIFGKHIDKLDADKAKKIHTLPVILGEKTSRYATLGMIALQFILVIYLVATQYLSPWVLIVFLSLIKIPGTVKMFLAPRPAERPANYPESIWPLWFVASSFYHNRIFGFLFLLGLILNLIF